jgi:hypothetical protein
VGVDFSPTMLERFAERWPEATLRCCDAASLPISLGKLDFVFSNGLLQYFDLPMLRQNLSRVAELLSDNGAYLIGNIPDRHLRSFYYAGALRSDRAASWRRLARAWLRVGVLRQRDGIGQWYSRAQMAHEAAENGFSCHTFSSASYEYRFHAVLTKEAGGSKHRSSGRGQARGGA